MIRELISIYLPSYPRALVYMLQSEEYAIQAYLRWVWRTKDFSVVMQRRSLELTKAARLLLKYTQVGILVQIITGSIFIALGVFNNLFLGEIIGALLLITYPFIWALLLCIPVIAGAEIIKPQNARLQKEATDIFKNHPGTIVAVLGSYGKTTMKELLITVLSEGYSVAATPANKNVLSSHATFARSLTDKEDIVIVEYGEGAPGDIAKLARLSCPDIAVITGLAPAHLDRYKTLEAAGKDIFSINQFVEHNYIHINADSPAIKPFLEKTYRAFNAHKALGWKVSDTQTSLEGTSLTITKNKQSITLHSSLIGAHHVGFLAFVAAFALEMGMSQDQVISGVARTKPFEHRMQQYQLAGAKIIDDTYNGNLEGLRAGTSLLHSTKAKRKIYVTPGLVDQGEETEAVHVEAGKLIAQAQPDIVVLMQNSVTKYIMQGLTHEGYKGELRLESNPLEFYTNLSHIVAAGDVVLMQNDWTDNYV